MQVTKTKFHPATISENAENIFPSKATRELFFLFFVSDNEKASSDLKITD